MTDGSAAPSNLAAAVLVVEDEPAIRRLVRRILTRAGFRVTAVGGVAEAVTHLRAAGYDLMLSDVRLPDGSGAALCSQALRLSPGLRTVLMSGAADDRARRLVERGMPFVAKPFSPEELLRAVRG